MRPPLLLLLLLLLLPLSAGARAVARAPARLSSVKVAATASTTPQKLEIDPNDPTNFTLGVLGDLHMDPRDVEHSYEAGRGGRQRDFSS